MKLDMSYEGVIGIRNNRPHPRFSRMQKLGAREGTILKELLPAILQDTSILIMDTNFANPLDGIDITKYLLESGTREEDKNLAQYILKNTYEEMKSVFELAKNGKIIVHPHIHLEIKGRNNALNVAMNKSRFPFHQKGYFLQFYNENDAEEMARCAKGVVSMSERLQSHIQRNGKRYSEQFDRAEKLQIQFIQDSLYLRK